MKIVFKIFFLFLLALLASCQNKETTSRTDAEINLAVSNGFFLENRSAEGVYETETGLQYKILRPGNGISPTLTSYVHVFFRGYFIGEETPFDYAEDESTPTRVPLSAVIAGWQEGLSIMTEGSIWMLYIPPHLAYGENGVPPIVGPNQALIYEIELVDVE